MTNIPTLTAPMQAVDVVDKATQAAFVTSQETFNSNIATVTVPAINIIAGEIEAVGATASTSAQLSEDYATKIALEVETGTYSAKEFAIGDLTATGGSAKAWATDTASPDGTTSKSAKTHSEDAATQAGIATTKAGEALASANNAYNSELAAAAILDGFDDRYLGAKTIDPTLDNDGNTLTAGAMYYNTTLDVMKVYDLELLSWVSISFTPTDHGTLTGLSDDDHPQYHNDTRGDARYLKLSGGSLTGALNTARATVASHATTADIWGALGNQIDFTGTATVTAFPAAPQAGAGRTLICAGACSFTAGANMLIDGVASGSTVMCATGDTVIVRAISTTQFKLTRQKSDGTAQVSVGASIARVTRTSNTILGASDSGKLIDITSGTFTQTFTASATLGSGWYCYLKNSGLGDITLDPYLSEMIDGLSSYIMYPNEVRLIQCDGVGFNSILIEPFRKVFTSSDTFIKPPHYSMFDAEGWGGGSNGGNYNSLTTSVIGGGGGGYNFGKFDSSIVPSSVTVTIGAGGVGTTTVSQTPNSPGGNTTFGSLLQANGATSSGGFGLGISATQTSNAKAFYELCQPAYSGVDQSNTAHSMYGGGKDNQQTNTTYQSFSWYGGGNGGGRNSSGVATIVGTSKFGGNGGDSGQNANGQDGVIPGGGGGATQYSSGTYTSGSGARGELRILGVM